MRGLFVRIFAALLFAIVLAGVGFSLVVAAEPASEGRRQRLAFLEDTLRLRGEQALTRVAEGRESEALREFEALERRSGVRTFLLRRGAPPLGPGGELPWLRAYGERASRERRTIDEVDASGRYFVAAVPVRDAVLVTAFPSPPSRLRFFLGSPRGLPMRLGVVFLAVSAVAFVLARTLTRPILRLRAAAQQLADGDLTVRVADEVRGATAEVSALGEDFDRLAERVAALLDGHERLLRDVSHELRSPLARLSLALEIARKRSHGTVDPELDRIERESERLASLVGHILTLARLADDAPLAEEEVDLAAHVRAIAADVDYEARPRGLRVTVAPHGPLLVHGHAEALRWAVENVLRNALAHTARDTEIEVSLWADERIARVIVRDRGPGVPEEALDAIFRPFYRVAADRDRRTGGAGVGLAITERVARRHGGSAYARAREGGGLEVTIELPRAREPS